ncbi:hypothetical protein [Nitrospina gracilis]|uniref:hypothetical protein n=1 Tax=Nitrospina gracilis TaxID=35801 RepID=UPI001F2CCC40|nr:hypothetical protein [Nitrospina gracilis]MCF8719611.1 hypothetical protein [Nitrospina gracilis Nb-211]
MYCMLNAMKDLMRAIRTLHPLWQVWVLLLMALNFAGPLFYFDRIEAIYTFWAGMLGAGIGLTLISFQGVTRLAGIMHAPWFCLLYYLWGRLPGLDLQTPFGLWLAAVMVCNAVSLVIDTVDVIRYLRGERAPLIDSTGCEV